MTRVIRLCIFVAIIAPAFSAEMTCAFLEANWLELGDYYGCYGLFTNTNDPEIVSEIKGQHSKGNSSEDVKHLSIWHDEVLTQIPKRIESFFPNLEVFDWWNGQLTIVSASDFETFPNLQVITLNNNKLVKLDSDLFQFTKHLNQIYFNENLLRSVGHDLLIGLDRLTLAYFTANPCIDLYALSYVDVQEMNRVLPIQCPPDGSPSPNAESNEAPSQCTIKCSSDQETNEFIRSLGEQEQMNAYLQEENINLKQIIMELESSMKERSESPDTCEKR